MTADPTPSLLARLPESDRRLLLERAVPRRFRRRQLLFSAGDAGDTMFVITAGRVAVRVVTVLGDVGTVAVLGAGETVGEQALVSTDARRTATVVAVEPTSALAITRAAFEDLRGSRPALDRLLVSVLSDRLTATTERLLEALYLPADVRIMRRVRHLLQLPGAGPPPVRLSITQEELAEMAGTTRSTVNRVLQAAQAAGGLELRRGGLVVIDEGVIAAMSSP